MVVDLRVAADYSFTQGTSERTVFGYLHYGIG
jgi:hypothetical protein